MKKLGLGLLVSLALSSIGVPSSASDVFFDDYSIGLTLSPTREEMIAFAQFAATTTAEAGLDSLCFFLHDELKVDNISDAAGSKLEFTQSKVHYFLSYSLAANKVCVKLIDRLARGDTLKLAVFYEGRFTETAVRSAADFMRFRSDGLFLRGPGCSLWFPTPAATVEEISARASMDVEALVPPSWKALTEGELSTGHTDQLLSFRWVTAGKIPISSAVLIASNYDTLSARVGRQKLSFWYFPSREDSSSAVRLFGAAKELLGFFVQNYGDYKTSSFPSRVTIVEMPIYGDFFSGTIIGVSKGRIRETSTTQKRAELASLIASKMVREFTVPVVDSAAPGAAFLLESVPSYAYVPAIEAVFGKSFVMESSESVMKDYVAGRKKGESKEPGFPREKPLAELSVSDIPRYRNAFLLEGRGAFVLHMLRKLIGDESFFLVMKSYMASFAEQPAGAGAGSQTPKRARIDDFIQIAEAASGKRLDWFFSEWLYGDVLPDYKIADTKVSVSHDTTFVDVKVENIGTGLMPVPVTLFTDKGQRTSEVWLAAHESAQMRFVSRSKPKRVEIDSQKWILQADISNDGVDIVLPTRGKK